jgi:hypothetical protein
MSSERPMHHCDAEELALAALGERTDIDVDHLAACEECQAELASLRRIIRSIRASAGTAITQPHDSVWEGVRAAMAASNATSEAAAGVSAGAAENPSHEDSGAVVVELPRRRGAWIALAAAVGLVLGGIAGGVIVQQAASTPPTIIAQTDLSPLDGFATTGTARVQSSADGESVDVDLTDLPETEGYFEVWLLTEDASAMVSLGAVGPGARTTVPLPPGIALDRFRVVDVSAEEFDGDPTHSAISVARGTLSI